MLEEKKEKNEKGAVSPNDPLMKPFTLGWTREVVNRVITKNRNLNCDIYYFSPCGKKIRSLTEIKSNLTDGLTPECFSFKRQPLGVNAKYETVRNAREKRKGTDDDTKDGPSKCPKVDKKPNVDNVKDFPEKIRWRKLEKQTTQNRLNKVKLDPNEKSENNNNNNSNDKQMKLRQDNPNKPSLNYSNKRKGKTKIDAQFSKRRLSTGKESRKKLATTKPPKLATTKRTMRRIVKNQGKGSLKNLLPGAQNETGSGLQIRNSKIQLTPTLKHTRKANKRIGLKGGDQDSVAELSDSENGKMTSAGTKDLRSIVKKNIGKYREMREKEKLAKFSSQKRTSHNKLGSPSVPRTRSEPISKNKQLYLKPFEKGWRRELVFRANCAKAGQHADVYYFHPNGKKLRSCREIAENLTQGLTIEYFTFRKEPIGCGEPSEIIRQARPHGK